jgi:outer membrane protein assembly factor BamD
MALRLRYIHLAFVSVLLLLAACSSTDEDAPQKEEAVETIYNRAADALQEGEYKAAVKDFEEVERQHPYSQWATQAQLMSAYASYKAEQYDDAVIALDRFIELHPGHENIAYAYYLKALSYYDQISDVTRDQATTMEALKALDTLIQRFPDSNYTRDATLKRDLTLDHLAGKEMEIGRYYLNRGFINAAINRFRVVIKDYQTTTHTAEALHRLVEAYLILGLKPEAEKVASVLGYNYPGSSWYQRSYELLDDAARARIVADRSTIDRTIDSIFKPD